MAMGYRSINQYPCSYDDGVLKLGYHARLRLPGVDTYMEYVYVPATGRRRVAVVYHGTSVVIFDSDGAAQLNSGGWNTRTTCARMNACLPDGYRVSLHGKRLFMVEPDGATYPFVFDEYTIGPCSANS